MIQSIWSFKVPGWCTVLEVRMAGWSLRRGNGREDCEGLFLDLAGGFLDELTLESLISLYTHGSCIFPSECSTCIKCRRRLWSGQQQNSSCVVLGPREGQCACWNQEIWVQMPAPPCPSPKPCWSFLCFLTFDGPIFLPHYRVVWGVNRWSNCTPGSRPGYSRCAEDSSGAGHWLSTWAPESDCQAWIQTPPLMAVWPWGSYVTSPSCLHL